MKRLARLCATALFVVLLSGTLLGAGLSVEELLTLRQVGFSEQEIRREVEKQGGPASLSEEEIAELKAGGFSDETIAFLKRRAGGGAAPSDDLAGILARIRAGEDLVEILTAIRRAGPDLRVNEATLRTLLEERRHAAILFALAKKPLTLANVKLLATIGMPAAAWPVLLAVTGVEKTEVSPTAIVDLARKGVPPEVLAALKQGQVGMAGGVSRRTGGVVTAAAEETRLETPGRYSHPLRLFELAFPEEWRLIRALQNGEITYNLTPVRGVVDPQRLEVSVQIMIVPVSEETGLRDRDARGVLEYLLPALKEMEPGLRRVGKIQAAALGRTARPAARVRFEGTLRGRDGNFVSESFVAPVGEVVIFASMLCRQDQFDARRPALLSVVDKSRFGYETPERRQTSLEARHIVERYLGSVVSVETDESTGSGFIISRDGYLLTNQHVVTSLDTGIAYPNIHVRWDESLRRPRVKARLIGTVRMVRGKFPLWGTDVAVLKIPPGDYEPLPLTPLAATRPGDRVVNLGFPARGALPGVSVTVTTGVLTRYNRGLDGRIDSIFVDATTEHGSSGGPCVSLVTGGVIGLTSFGWDLESAQAMGLENLADYYGVAPTDQVLLHFPLITRAGIEPSGGTLDFLDAYGLSRMLTLKKSHLAAMRLADRAADLRPDLPDAHAQKGESLLAALRERHRSRPDLYLKDLPRVAVELRKALAKDPVHERSLVALAVVTAEMGETEKALEFVNAAIRAHESSWQAPLVGAHLLLQLKRYEEALEHARLADQRVASVLPEPHIVAGRVHYAMGRAEEGLASFRRAVERNPASVEANLGVADYHDLMGRPEEAIAAYRRLLDRFPQNPVILTKITTVNYRHKRWGEVRRVGREALAAANANLVLPTPELLLMMSRAGLEDEEWEALFEASSIFLLLYPGHPRAIEHHLLLADLHRQAGNPGLATGHIRLARRAGETPEVKRVLRKFKPSPLTLKEVKTAIELRYQRALLAELIRTGPLAFPVETPEQVQALLREDRLPVIVVKALVDAHEEHGVEPVPGAVDPGENQTPEERPSTDPPGEPEEPTEEPPLITLIGKWKGSAKDAEGKAFTMSLTIRANQQYHLRIEVAGEGPSEHSGPYLADGQLLRLMLQGGSQAFFQYKLTASTLTLTAAAQGWRIRLDRQ